ncbi:chronophin [Halyomorpha halys]|uniref:chronophin n=1 Tax=Halyomorpha halys TaxID=286706 RepID=UPI0006D4CC6E|nr:pyridoxal phosphate phosphatase-like [Halyomorpha halys]
MARKMIDFSKLNSHELEDFRNKYDAYIFDMDGVLVHLEASPINGVKEVLEEIARNGKSIYVLTDNCLAKLKDITEKVTTLFPAIKKENVMCCTHLAVRYLKEINFNKKVYVIGVEDGPVAELKDHGFQVVHDEEVTKIGVGDLRKAKFETGVGAVLVAGDYNFNYMKMFKAANYLVDPKVLLMQTHLSDIANRQPVVPAVGSLVSAVKAGSGRKDSIAMGKGSEYCNSYLKSLGFPSERCLFVGDGIECDMVAGNISGMDTMLTLSGMSFLKDVESAKAKKMESYIPTYYTNSVADLMRVFKTQ